MKTGPALALIAAGAILAFAVHAHLGFFSFQIAGWVIMLTGMAGLVIPRRGHSWLRRITRRPRTAAGADGDRRLRRVTRRPRAAAGSGGGGRLPIGWTFRRRPNPAEVPSPPPAPYWRSRQTVPCRARSCLVRRLRRSSSRNSCEYEALYGNMPVFGLAAAAGHLPTTQKANTAAARVRELGARRTSRAQCRAWAGS